MILYINKFENSILKILIYKCYPFLDKIFKKQIRTIILEKIFTKHRLRNMPMMKSILLIALHTINKLIS